MMDMYNWDMVCAASCEHLNQKLIEQRDLLISDFVYTDDYDNSITGSFDSWQITTGGSSQRIRFLTKIKTGELNTKILGESITQSVDGICPLLEMELSFIGQNENTDLVFNCKKVVSTLEDGKNENGAIFIINDDVNNVFSGDDRVISQTYAQLMAQMLVQNNDKIKFIFSELMNIPSSDINNWMTPHVIQYSYNEHISGELGSLAVLTILKSNPNPPDISTLELEFDPDLVRSNDVVGFAIAKWAFMQYVILAGMPALFDGANISHFQIQNDIIHNNGRIPLSQINGYTPYFDSTTVEIVDDKIILTETNGRCDVVSYSSYVTFSLSGTYKPSLINGNTSNPKVLFNQITQPVFTTEVHDTAALVFWIFGGWVVDALVRGIESQMKTWLWDFGSYGLAFTIFPINMNVSEHYKECGLAENFYMRG